MNEQLSTGTQTFMESHKEKKVVFTNGCFDILHPGHVTYLNMAKELGDVLVVGLNSDLSVQRIKGPGRPINSELDRKFMLESLRSVDCVEIFDQETPLELIKAISPHILVKGGDWKVEEIVGFQWVKQHGGEVFSLPFKQGHSTTSLIKSLQGKN
jgi:rfaE bifunctional protein nucleotidyltransferase chain/domain